MSIWVDADACPVPIKQILFKAAERTKTHTYFVANQYLQLAKSEYLHMQQVPKGFDVADNAIVQFVKASDLVITSDIPLADEVITKGATALSPRGEEFTKNNIKSRLNMRDFMDTLRSSGIQTSGQQPLNNADKQSFANALDRYLTQQQS